MTLNGAEIWVFCSCAELWIGCETAISSGHPRDRQATLPKTHSALPRLVPREGRRPGPRAGGQAGSWGIWQRFHTQAIPRACTWETFPDPVEIQWPKPDRWLMRSRAGQKTIAAKLLAAGFWISLQKPWHMDQSRMASPVQDWFAAGFFYKTKLKLIPLGSICFQWTLVPVKKNKNKAFLIHWCLTYNLCHSPFITSVFNSGQCNTDECLNIQFSNTFMLVSISLSSLIFNCLKQL